MEHLFFDSIDEMRNQTGSHGPNYLRNHTAERDYFSPLSIVTSIQKPQEYLFSNYMDAWSFCVHTPNKHEFFHETYMHKHNFFELMYVQRGQVRVMIEGAETTYTQGNLCLLNRNTMHRETDMSNADIVYIGIDASLLTQWPKSFPPPFQYKSILNQFFSDNLDHLDDENIYRKLQNHWIIEMGEMKATITAKNIEQIKSFLSRQKETYKVPYEVHPEDRPRQCVFCGTSNDLNFLPLDRTGNRRFAPVMTDMSKAEVHILDNEAESKAYIEQAWAEAMVLYRQGNVFLGFTKEIEEEAKRLQKEFMPEDTNAGIIQAFLDDYDDDYVCTRILFDEALHRTGEMKQWEGKEIANIMNNAIEGWKPHGTHRFGKEYGIQRSRKRIEGTEKKDKDGFMEVPEQLKIPFE